MCNTSTFNAICKPTIHNVYTNFKSSSTMLSMPNHDLFYYSLDQLTSSRERLRERKLFFLNTHFYDQILFDGTVSGITSNNSH